MTINRRYSANDFPMTYEEYITQEDLAREEELLKTNVSSLINPKGNLSADIDEI